MRSGAVWCGVVWCGAVWCGGINYTLIDVRQYKVFIYSAARRPDSLLVYRLRNARSRDNYNVTWYRHYCDRMT